MLIPNCVSLLMAVDFCSRSSLCVAANNRARRLERPLHYVFEEIRRQVFVIFTMFVRLQFATPRKVLDYFGNAWCTRRLC